MNRRIGNPLLTGILNLFFRSGLSDAHCGLRAFRKAAFERLADWRLRPEASEGELGIALEELVEAEGLWDWDELAAEAALALPPVPDEYWDMEIHRDEQRRSARRAFILALAEAARY